MVQIEIDEATAKLIREAMATGVELVDPSGHPVGAVRPLSYEEMFGITEEEARRRAASDGPWRTSGQVRQRLRDLERGADRAEGEAA